MSGSGMVPTRICPMAATTIKISRTAFIWNLFLDKIEIVTHASCSLDCPAQIDQLSNLGRVLKWKGLEH